MGGLESGRMALGVGLADVTAADARGVATGDAPGDVGPAVEAPTVGRADDGFWPEADGPPFWDSSAKATIRLAATIKVTRHLEANRYASPSFPNGLLARLMRARVESCR